MTEEQQRISDKNYGIAKKYFNLPKGCVLHHVNPEWKHTDIERYIQWNPEDLVVMTQTEHNQLHGKMHTGANNVMANLEIRLRQKDACNTPEQRARRSEVATKYFSNPEARLRSSERTKGSNNPMYGRKHTEESRRKMSVTKGMHRVYNPDGTYHYEF